MRTKGWKNTDKGRFYQHFSVYTYCTSHDNTCMYVEGILIYKYKRCGGAKDNKKYRKRHSALHHCALHSLYCTGHIRVGLCRGLWPKDVSQYMYFLVFKWLFAKSATYILKEKPLLFLTFYQDILHCIYFSIIIHCYNSSATLQPCLCVSAYCICVSLSL